MLLFRNRLRAMAPERDLCQGTKRELADRRLERIKDYADAKSSVFGEIISGSGRSTLRLGVGLLSLLDRSRGVQFRGERTTASKPDSHVKFTSISPRHSELSSPVQLTALFGRMGRESPDPFTRPPTHRILCAELPSKCGGGVTACAVGPMKGTDGLRLEGAPRQPRQRPCRIGCSSREYSRLASRGVSGKAMCQMWPAGLSIGIINWRARGVRPVR
jgi:hypothetical protein